MTPLKHRKLPSGQYVITGLPAYIVDGNEFTETDPYDSFQDMLSDKRGMQQILDDDNYK